MIPDRLQGWIRRLLPNPISRRLPGAAPEHTEDPPSTPPESVARNTAFAAATELTGALFTAALTLFLVRELGPGDYGIYALALSIGALAVLISDAGISASAARFIAERHGERPVVIGVLHDALRLKLLVSVCVSTLLFLLSEPIANAYDVPSLTWPLRAISIAVFGQSLMFLAIAAFTALGRIRLSLWTTMSEGAVEASSSTALVLLGAGVTGATFGRAIGFAFAALVGGVLLARVIGLRRRPSAVHPGDWRRIAGYAAPLLVIDGAMTLFQRIDVLLIGAFLGASSVGLFDAPLRVTTFLHYGGLAVASGVAPRLARGGFGERQDSPGELFSRALRYVILGQGLLLAPLVIWASPIVDLILGPQYEESTDVLRALTPYMFLSGIAPLVALGVTYLGEARRRIPVAIGALTINLVIDVILIPKIGIIGGAIGTGVAYAVYVPAHFILCQRLLDLEVRGVMLTLGRTLVAATAMAAVLYAIGTEDLSPSAWIAGSIGGTLVYLAALLATREVLPGELRRLGQEVAGRMPRLIWGSRR